MAAAGLSSSPKTEGEGADPVDSADSMQLDDRPKPALNTSFSNDTASSPAISPLVRKSGDKENMTDAKGTFKVPLAPGIKTYMPTSKDTSAKLAVRKPLQPLNTGFTVDFSNSFQDNARPAVKSFGALGSRRTNINSAKLGGVSHWAARGRSEALSRPGPSAAMRKSKSSIDIMAKKSRAAALADFSSPCPSSPLSRAVNADQPCSSPTPAPTLRPTASYDDTFKRPRRSNSRSSGSPDNSPRAPKFRRTVSLCETTEAFMSSLGDDPRKVAEQDRTANKVAASMRMAVSIPRRPPPLTLTSAPATTTCFGSNSPGFCLPSLPRKADDPIKRITTDTLGKVLSGEYRKGRERFLVLDCRFPYEFEGGHIEGAINCSTVEQVEKMYNQGMGKVAGAEPSEKVVLIFHCEYSVHRAPRMALHLRNLDRHRNLSRYPHLDYPEIYVLQGGYNGFYKCQQRRAAWCRPQAYIEMRDTSYKDQLAFHLNEYKHGGLPSSGEALQADPTGTLTRPGGGLGGSGLIRKGMWGRTKSFTYGEHMRRKSSSTAVVGAAVFQRQQSIQHDKSRSEGGFDFMSRLVGTGGLRSAPPILQSTGEDVEMEEAEAEDEDEDEDQFEDAQEADESMVSATNSPCPGMPRSISY